MAEEHHHQDTTIPISSTTDEPKVESTDRGLFGFGKKEEEKQPQEEALATDFAKVHVSEPHPKVEEHKEEEEVKKHSLLEKLHRSDSSSSSSSEEEEGKEGEEKKKKKKEKKKKEEVAVPVEVAQAEEKKGFLEKIKDKLPGGQPKKTEEVTPTTTTHAVPAAPTVTATHTEEEHKEKKGILEKIKEKLPGYHSKPEEDKDEKKEIKD